MVVEQVSRSVASLHTTLHTPLYLCVLTHACMLMWTVFPASLHNFSVPGALQTLLVSERESSGSMSTTLGGLLAHYRTHATPPVCPCTCSYAHLDDIPYIPAQFQGARRPTDTAVVWAVSGGSSSAPLSS